MTSQTNGAQPSSVEVTICQQCSHVIDYDVGFMTNARKVTILEETCMDCELLPQLPNQQPGFRDRTFRMLEDWGMITGGSTEKLIQLLSANPLLRRSRITDVQHSD